MRAPRRGIVWLRGCPRDGASAGCEAYDCSAHRYYTLHQRNSPVGTYVGAKETTRVSLAVADPPWLRRSHPPTWRWLVLPGRDRRFSKRWTLATSVARSDAELCEAESTSNDASCCASCCPNAVADAHPCANL